MIGGPGRPDTKPGRRFKDRGATLFAGIDDDMPEYREKGYGTRLLKEVEHECHEDGMRILAVQVRTDNQKGIRFFENSGFSVINALSEKKVIMEKNLQ